MAYRCKHCGSINIYGYGNRKEYYVLFSPKTKNGQLEKTVTNPMETIEHWICGDCAVKEETFEDISTWSDE